MPKAATGKRCPICGKSTDETRKPFCSQRCADIDLHRWLSGSYAIPGGTPEDDPDAVPAQNDERDR